MPVDRDVLRQLVVEPGKKAKLAGRLPGATDGVGRAKDALASSVSELEAAQELLWASDTYALLVIFQALDAAGKDGTIKHVMSGVNPQGCQVVAFKQPSAEELDHTFLWRHVRALPDRGRIGIFNRSYYEEVLVVRVHPDALAHEHLPSGPKSDKLWRQRYDDINAFEHHLDRNGTKVVKFFLHVSKEEQKRRFLARLDDPHKQWKFSPADVAEREHWDEYMAAYEETLTETSTRWAPWYVIPADHKPVMRALVASVLVDRIHALDLRYPKVPAEQRAALDDARRRLLAEG